MKRLKKTAFLVSTLVFVTFFSACEIYSYVPPANTVSYENPTWAPPYTPGVRYYYLPDIECYYDLTNQEFMYLDNGQWSYSQTLPPMYAGYDLSDAFTVAVNFNTYQPWMHHQYYVSHYPRYYYRDYYDHSNIPYVRGFNENKKSAVYWSENERSRARRWDNQNENTNHQFNYSVPDRQHQINNNTPTRRPDNYNTPTRRPDNSTFNTNTPTRTPDNNTPTRRPDNSTFNNNAPIRTPDNNQTVRKPDNNTGNNPVVSRPENNNNPTVRPPDNNNNMNNNNNNNRQQPPAVNNRPTPPANQGNVNSNRPDVNNGNKNTPVVVPRISGFESGARQQKEVTPVRQNQGTNYYGRTIGQPVKVQKQMRQATPATPRVKTEPRDNNKDTREPADNSRR